MPFTRVVILGGGPIGLLCAIEAKRYFPEVVIIEKRGGYTRTNVPSLNNELIGHLKKIDVASSLWPTGQATAGDSIAFSKIEDALWHKAQSIGVAMERGYTVSAILGLKKMENGRFKRMRITLAPWDDKNKCLMAQAPTKEIFADLLVVASGGSAARDQLVCQTLGFSFTSLKAKNYAAFGIFNPGRNDEPGDYLVKSHFASKTNEIVSGKIAFSTPDHNYLLVTLSQCTKRDFQYLQSNTKAFHTLLNAVSEGYRTDLQTGIKDVQKNMGLFKVSIQRVRHFYSSTFPAVIVGDAAVTPHPEAGSGMVTGFAGVQQLSTLFEALHGTNRSADNSGCWMYFNQQYELFVSKKALEGTKIILRNLIKLMERFCSDVRGAEKVCQHKGARELLGEMGDTSDILRSVLDLHQLRAERLLGILNGDAEKFDWRKCGADQLWSDIGIAYQSIKKVTSDMGILEVRLDGLELTMATQKIMGKGVQV